jgi:hypothetical protein
LPRGVELKLYAFSATFVRIGALGDFLARNCIAWKCTRLHKMLDRTAAEVESYRRNSFVSIPLHFAEELAGATAYIPACP